MTISKSPDRNTFQKERYLERQAEKGKTPDNDEDTQAMVEFYESFDRKEDEREADPEWQKNNLEWDLRTTDWILTKARADDAYAQNIYSALCNNGFIKLDVIPILKEEEWSCSWRYAGGIVAHMQETGDYIDWYCSGIRDHGYGDTEEEELKKEELTEEQKIRKEIVSRYVPEGMITAEIRADFKRLGWIPAKGGDWENFDEQTDSSQ
jgi:hypothetical protein